MFYCIDALESRVLVIDEVFSDLVEEPLRAELGTGVRVITTGNATTDYEEPMKSFVGDRNEGEPDVRVRGNDVAAILWTTGTTSRPKG